MERSKVKNIGFVRMMPFEIPISRSHNAHTSKKTESSTEFFSFLIFAFLFTSPPLCLLLVVVFEP